MNLDALNLSIGLAGGFAAGGIFFAGLYLTTRRLTSARRPGLLAVASFVARTALVVGTAVPVATGLGAGALLAFAVGLTVARVAIVRFVRRGNPDAPPPSDTPGERATETPGTSTAVHLEES